jgi:membrane fusion protein (multidrug efflux system)
MAAASVQVQTVSAAAAKYSEWRPKISAVGSLTAMKGADLSLEVAGIVSEIDFHSGEDVKKGALLLKLRAESDVAKLNSLQALAALAKINYERDLKQFKIKAVSQATLDTDAANLKNADAQVAEQQAIIDQKTLRAPFAGRLGIRAVNLGQYLSPGTAIVTLQSLNPIFVDFYVPQQEVSQLHVGDAAAADIDAYKGQTFAGKISALNAKVDPSTRNIQIQGTLPNPGNKLLPGMYATVEIATGAPHRYLTLAQTAITYNPYGDTVFVLDRKDAVKGNAAAKGAKAQWIARQTFVTTGPTRDNEVAVLKGIKEGDMVVTSGQIKLHNGSLVVINNSVAPDGMAAAALVDR